MCLYFYVSITPVVCNLSPVVSSTVISGNVQIYLFLFIFFFLVCNNVKMHSNVSKSAGKYRCCMRRQSIFSNFFFIFISFSSFFFFFFSAQCQLHISGSTSIQPVKSLKLSEFFTVKFQSSKGLAPTCPNITIRNIKLGLSQIKFQILKNSIFQTISHQVSEL